MPGGFQNRLVEVRMSPIDAHIHTFLLTCNIFQIWITWEERVEADGHRSFIIAWCPLEEYRGTHYEVDGGEKMHEATSRGAHIIKECTNNTCEWTWVQQVDLKFTTGENLRGAKRRAGITFTLFVIWVRQCFTNLHIDGV